MNVREIQLSHSAQGDNFVNCPICGKYWLPTDELEPTPCEHLQFIWHENTEMQPFDFNHQKYMKAYADAFKRVNEDDDLYSVEVSPEEDVFRATASDEIDEVVYATLHGMACGPVSYTTYFGVKR